MKCYLNGEPGSMDDYSLIEGLEFAGLRVDCLPGDEERVVKLFKPNITKLRPLFLVNGGKMTEAPESAGGRASRVALMMHDYGVQGEIEIGNEPNIAEEPYRSNPAALTRSILTAWNVMQKDRRIKDTRLVVGGIMNTDKGGQAYLEEVLRGLPGQVIVGYHTYRQWDKPAKPSKGYRTREEEFGHLIDIAGGRELWNTEIGWHTAKEKKHFWSKPKGLSKEEVFERLKGEARFNYNAGAKVYTVFQLNCGPGDTYEDEFGIREFDRVTLRPSSGIAQWVNA